MRAFNPLKPLKIAKRKTSDKYSSLPIHEPRNSRDSIDSEKHAYPESYCTDDYDSSSPSSPTSPRSLINTSRDTSGSYDSNRPMLRRRIPPTHSRSPAYFIPRRMMRYLCCAMISTVFLLIVFLIRMSILDTRKLEEYGDRRAQAPKQWESFRFLERYYGGIRSLVPLSENKPEYPRAEDELPLSNVTIPANEQARGMPQSKTFNAYPDYTSTEYLKDFVPVQPCYLDTKSTVRIPPLQYYDGRPSGFPDHIMGSYEVLDLPEGICFERYGRLGPYGHGYSLRKGGLGSGRTGDAEGSEQVWSKVPAVDYTNVDWAVAQQRCYNANAARFRSGAEKKQTAISARDGVVPKTEATATPKDNDHPKTQAGTKLRARTAVVVRTWDEFIYREEDILYLRSLISELSIGSGGEYDVYLLVQVKDQNIPVFADEATYQRHLEERVPAEFRGIATLWSESQMHSLYFGLEEIWARGPGLMVDGVYRGLVLALQWFAHNHPEYDFFWQWEMDLRYTGHMYHLFSKFDSWSEKQPRKLLWERSSRFYIPSAHGSWDDFSQMVRVQTESGTESPNNVWSGFNTGGANRGPQGEKPIWGPERPQNENDWFETENDPVPPTTFAKDKYTWGVGEAADLITLNPLFDPEGTTWGLGNDATGYNRTAGLPPRRAAIITASRMSKRLLNTMHRETAIKKHHAFSEMWAPLTALSHGYKAVYVPHPMFVDREWPVEYLAATMNAGRNGASGGARTSVFGDREHNLLGMTWYYNAGFAGNLWRRWLGLKVDDLGGERFEMGEDGGGGNGVIGGQGRMCVPPMLIHPVKEVELPVEEVVIDHGAGEMGPDA